MESIYYVTTWLCHRSCPHCYEERFRPYYSAELHSVTKQSRANFRRILSHFPERLTYLDRQEPLPAGGYREKPGSVILAGGEVLLDPVRESVLYLALDILWNRYQRNGGVKLIVQTTGDLLTPKIIQELLDHHVWLISVSGIDAFHAGLETGGAQARLKEKLTAMFLDAGMQHQPKVAAESRNADEGGRYFHFFGATPDMWIGRLWPRGRAWQNGLSTAGIEDNFCNRWSGGRGFLDYDYDGSEVSIDPEGNVFPCCPKTRAPIGNLLDEPLLAILDRLRGNPVWEAINAGQPQRMGLTHGWSEEKFLEASTTRDPAGRTYRNLCIGCDRFHEEVLLRPELVRIR